MLRLPTETPLVGFRGKVDEHGLVSLGLIFVDTIDPVCQTVQSAADISMYKGLSETEQSKIVEDEMTQDEKDRAKALETILIYDSIAKARQSKEEVLK